MANKNPKEQSSFIPSNADGPNSYGAPNMKNVKGIPPGNAGSSQNIKGSPGVLKKVNSQNTFKSGHKK